MNRPTVGTIPKSAVGKRNTQSLDDNIVMVGAGLCGALAAIMLADRGYNIDIYERREEAHLFADSGRSFNITLTERGFRALRMVGLDEKIMKAGMKCFGRHVHDAKSREKEPEKTFWTSYGTNVGTDFLLSISRVKLNKILLEEMVLRSDKIRITYGHKCIVSDLKNGVLKLQNMQPDSPDKDNIFEVRASLILGTDGCWSGIRQQMMREHPTEFSQRFSASRYKELYTPPINMTPSSTTGTIGSNASEAGEYAYGGIEKANGLHLWPRQNFMLLAMPNHDKSYSTTLFATEEIFHDLNNGGPVRVREFFQEHFPDAAAKMSTLEEDFSKNPTGTLTECRCYPYHFSPYSFKEKKSKTTDKRSSGLAKKQAGNTLSPGAAKQGALRNTSSMGQVPKTLLMGDAAHAMYPFMGQGTNCAFEDCAVLIELLERHEDDWMLVLPAFSEARKPHADALTDMAAEHDKTLCQMSFSFSKELRLLMSRAFPAKFRPLYSAVAFTATPYGDCIDAEKDRMKTIEWYVTIASYMAVGMLVFLLCVWWEWEHLGQKWNWVQR